MNAPADTTILQLDDLSVGHPGAPPLVTGWSASIGGGVTQLYGDTGSGKTTLLRVLAGELPATGGRLTLAGAALDRDPEAYRRALFYGDPSTDAFEQISARACSAALHAGDAAFDAHEWQALVDGFALTPHLDKPMYMLSTGSRRKVWLAVALASGRALTLLDEPTGGLDGPSIGCLWRAVAKIAERARGRALVIASAERIERAPLAASIELPLR